MTLPYLDTHPRLLRLFRNAGIVLSGNVVSAAIGLLVLAMLTRALSLEDFGLYSLVVAYIGLINRLTTFDSWKALIHYGAHAREQKDNSQLLNLFAFGWILDLLGGILGFVVALLGAAFVPHWFGLQSEALTLTTIMASTLLFNWVAAPTAFLRLFNRFISQAFYQFVSGVIQFVTVLCLWLSEVTSMIPYLLSTAVCGIIGQLFFFALGLREARRQGFLHWHHLSLSTLPVKCPGLWRFAITTNVDGIVRALRDVDIFLVNGLLGASSAGLYKIARVLTKALGRLTGPFFQAIYPELAHLAAAGKSREMAKLMRQSSVTLGVVVGLAWLAFIPLGPHLLSLAFTPSYANAYPLALWCMSAMVVWAVAQPLSPALLALRKPGASLVVHFVTTSAYIGLLYVCILHFGLAGSGMALLAFYLIWSLSMLAVVKSELQKLLENP